MIENILLFVAGAVGGVLGGMGMGGGTLLIPILTFFFEIEQKDAQLINLLSFVPMAIIALILHAKNKLIKMKGLIPLAICALLLSVGGSFLVRLVEGDLQTKLFGGFLTLLAIVKFIASVKSSKQN